MKWRSASESDRPARRAATASAWCTAGLFGVGLLDKRLVKGAVAHSAGLLLLLWVLAFGVDSLLGYFGMRGWSNLMMIPTDLDLVIRASGFVRTNIMAMVASVLLLAGDMAVYRRLILSQQRRLAPIWFWGVICFLLAGSLLALGIVIRAHRALMGMMG